MKTIKTEKMKVPLKVFANEGEIEMQSIEQMKKVARLPFLGHHLALMPDGHLGKGASIGSVIPTRDVLIPNLVGSDIGCGVCAVKTSLTAIDAKTLKKIVEEIRKAIPVGFSKHKAEQDESLMPVSHSIYSYVEEKVLSEHKQMEEGFVCHSEYKNALRSLGTSGGGNHFLEIQKGDDGYIWVMIHSGSRNLGLQVADYYNKVAIELNRKWHSSVPEEWQLAFLPIDSDEGQAYIREMQYCVDYAFANRKLMMDRIKDIFEDFYEGGVFGMLDSVLDFDEMINIAHNYARLENHFGQNVWVHRKGATSAKAGEVGIIPGSMGGCSYIVKGRGNKESFESSPHGAGRRLSRTKAREYLNLEEEQKKIEQQGAICSLRDKSQLDEAPSAYKDIDTVMENSKELVDKLVELKPLITIKG